MTSSSRPLPWAGPGKAACRPACCLKLPYQPTPAWRGLVQPDVDSIPGKNIFSLRGKEGIELASGKVVAREAVYVVVKFYILLEYRDRVVGERSVFVVEAVETRFIVLFKAVGVVDLPDSFDLSVRKFLHWRLCFLRQHTTVLVKPLVYYGSSNTNLAHSVLIVLRLQREGFLGLGVGVPDVDGNCRAVVVDSSAPEKSWVSGHLFHGSTVTVCWSSGKKKALPFSKILRSKALNSAGGGRGIQNREITCENY